MFRFTLRHKFRFLDLTAVIAATSLTLYAGLTYNIFNDAPGHHPASQELELDELAAVIAVLVIGLTWAIQRLLRQRREASRKAAVQREFRRLAFSDSLTGLPNRREFDNALKAAAATPPRTGASHAVFMLDLNGFKRINDIFGHAAGDELLIHVSGRLNHALREGDLLARLGGDEFAILATHLPSPEAASTIAQRIIESLDQPVRTTSGAHTIGTAIGIALTPQNGAAPEDLLRKADIALYRAKEQPASAMRFFEPDMDIRIRERDHMERELRAAVQAEHIRLCYQPVMDLRTGSVRAFEGLARWTHPDFGNVDPERFISIAEDAGLIGILTDQLLRQGCLDSRQWDTDIELAINLSPAQLHDAGLTTRILAILSETGFPPHRLELEITESALVKDLHAAQSTLGALRQAGVRIALDDFGTGCSSLYHLRNFKVDRIKIDRSFIASMTQDSECRAIVQALVGLGSGLGIEVTAEGVESETQRRFLLDHGCGQAQGFLYSQAVPAQQTTRLLTTTPTAAA